MFIPWKRQNYCIIQYNTIAQSIAMYLSYISVYRFCTVYYHISINSLRPNDANIRRKSDHYCMIMACRLVGAKPLSKPMRGYCFWTIRNKLQWNFNRNSYILIQENAFENVVCDMVAIMSRPQSINMVPRCTYFCLLIFYLLPIHNFPFHSKYFTKCLGV